MADGSGPLLFAALTFAVFYFILIRPQRRRMQAQQQLQAKLQLGDEVVTIGGFVATVRRFDGDLVTIELSPGVEARIRRGAIAGRVEPTPPAAAGPDDGGGPEAP